MSKFSQVFRETAQTLVSRADKLLLKALLLSAGGKLTISRDSMVGLVEDQDRWDRDEYEVVTEEHGPDIVVRLRKIPRCPSCGKLEGEGRR